MHESVVACKYAYHHADGRLVMDGDFKGIVICSLLIIVIYLILHFLFWKNDVHTTKVIAS